MISVNSMSPSPRPLSTSSRITLSSTSTAERNSRSGTIASTRRPSPSSELRRMSAALRSLSRSWAGLPVLLLFVALLTTRVSAAEAPDTSDTEQHVRALTEITQEFEALAAGCVGSEDSASTACTDFLAAVDGNLGKNYSSHCDQLRSWRSALINRRFNAAAGTADSATTDESDVEASDDRDSEAQRELDLMIATAALCDNGSRLSNNESIVSAFALATSAQRSRPTHPSAYDADAVDRLFRAQRNETLQQQERLRQRQNIEQEQQRILQQNENAQRQLEAELLRQQLRRSPPL